MSSSSAELQQGVAQAADRIPLQSIRRLLAALAKEVHGLHEKVDRTPDAKEVAEELTRLRSNCQTQEKQFATWAKKVKEGIQQYEQRVKDAQSELQQIRKEAIEALEKRQVVNKEIKADMTMFEEKAAKHIEKLCAVDRIASIESTLSELITRIALKDSTEMRTFHELKERVTAIEIMIGQIQRSRYENNANEADPMGMRGRTAVSREVSRQRSLSRGISEERNLRRSPSEI